MKSHRRRPSAGYRPRIEVLEDRAVPADFSGSISGTAFVDRNHNGHFDARERALQGAPVKLDGTTGQGVAVHVLVKADAEGKFRFDNVMPGHYRLHAGRASIRLPGPTVRVVLTPGQNLTRNVAFGAIRPGAVNLRQLLNNSPPGSVGTPTAGTGVAKAADRPDNKPIPKGTLADVTVAKNKVADTFVDMAAFFDDVDMANSRVVFHTTAGNINVELFDRAAPQTVANFLNYVTSNKYDSSVFHRLATGFVLQGGGFTYNEDLRTITDIPDGPAVKNEFDGVNRSNLQGTIAMAKLGADVPGGGPDSATNQFFFNLANNASNLDTQNGGFTVFGKIVGTADQTVLNALAAFTPTNKSSFNSAFDTFPLKNYTGTNFPTDVTPANLAMITDVEVVSRPEQLKYTVVSNTNEPVVHATFVNNQLKINPVANQTGTATLTIRATDKFGATVDRSFNVIVANNSPSAALTLAPASVNNDGQLTASVTASDPNGDAVKVKYDWTVKHGANAPVNVQTFTSDGTSNTSSNILNLANVPGGVQPGDIVTVTVTPNDGTVDGTPATASRTVGDRLPSLTNAGFTNGEVGVDGTLTFAAAGTDPDGSTVTFDYEWSYNGQVVKTTPGDDGSDSLNLLTEGPATRHTGDVVLVKVTPRADGVPGSSSTVTFTIDRAPTTDGMGPQTFTNRASPVSFDTSGNFSDPDGDTLTFTATLANGDPLPAWLTMATDGTLNVNPGPGDAGSYQIKVTASDNPFTPTTPPLHKTVSTTFTLTVTNAAPTLVPPLNLTAGPVFNDGSLTASATASDVNNDQVTVNYVWKVGNVEVRNVNLIGGNTSDTLNLSAINPSVLPAGVHPGDVVTVTVTPTDGALAGPSVSDQRTIADRLPSFTAGSPQFTNGEVGVDGTLTVAAAGTDPDGSAVTFDYEWSYNGQPVRTVLGGGGSDSLNLLTQGPAVRNSGDVVTVTVTPKAGGAAGTSSTLTFTVNQTPTTDHALTDQTFSSSGVYSLNTFGDFHDPDSDALTFAAKLDNGNPLPGWLTINPTTGVLSGNPAASDAATLNIVVTATDTHGASITDDFQLVVTSSVNDAPTLSNPTLTPAAPLASDASVSADVTVNDPDGPSPVSLTYVWKNLTANTVLRTSPATTATSDTLTLSSGDVATGDQLQLTVTAFDGLTTVQSQTTVTVG
jgi:peptidyl-prolyl cis-trans isomerase A (cyclophilin A)